MTMSIQSRVERLFEAETRMEAAESRLVEVEAQRDRLRDVLDRLAGIVARNCGWLPHEDQQTLREARAAVEESR